MDDLTLDQLKERETQAEAAFNSGRHVTKDKESTVRIVDILEAVEG
jgi:hypothetical protein